MRVGNVARGDAAALASRSSIRRNRLGSSMRSKNKAPNYAQADTRGIAARSADVGSYGGPRRKNSGAAQISISAPRPRRRAARSDGQGSDGRVPALASAPQAARAARSEPSIKARDKSRAGTHAWRPTSSQGSTNTLQPETEARARRADAPSRWSPSPEDARRQARERGGEATRSNSRSLRPLSAFACNG
jgi:hypothetical protein